MYVLIMSHTLFRVNPHYICLNVKELVAQSKRKIWSLVHERTLNHLAKMAKWLSCVVSTYQINTHNKVSLAKWWVFVYEPIGCGFESSCRHWNYDQYFNIILPKKKLVLRQIRRTEPALFLLYLILILWILTKIK